MKKIFSMIAITLALIPFSEALAANCSGYCPNYPDQSSCQINGCLWSGGGCDDPYECSGGSSSSSSSGSSNSSSYRCPSNCKTCSGGKCSACKDGYYHYTSNADLCVPVDYTLADGTKITHPIVAYPNYCARVGQKWVSSGANSSRATGACVDINCEPGKTLTQANGYALCKQCKAGYELQNNRCIARENTVSGSCPDGLSKSADGCCCVK